MEQEILTMLEQINRSLHFMLHVLVLFLLMGVAILIDVFNKEDSEKREMGAHMLWKSLIGFQMLYWGVYWVSDGTFKLFWL